MSAYVLGEHGDSQSVCQPCTVCATIHTERRCQIAWSSATVGSAPLLKVLPLNAQGRKDLAQATANKAYQIIEAKGFTSYGIGAVSALICESIIFDQRQIFPLSHYQDHWQCCLSTPIVIGRGGLGASMPLQLEDDEMELLNQSAKSLREVLARFEKET